MEECLTPLKPFLHCYCLNIVSSFSDPFILGFPPSPYICMSPEPPYTSPASLHSPRVSKTNVRCGYFEAVHTFFSPPKFVFHFFFNQKFKKVTVGLSKNDSVEHYRKTEHRQ